jgi:hypothetical protein
MTKDQTRISLLTKCYNTIGRTTMRYDGRFGGVLKLNALHRFQFLQGRILGGQDLQRPKYAKA